MKVLISWSGPLSHKIACILRDWLPSVLQHVDPWVSSEDIDKGARWIAELGNQLQEARFGIICLVPGNLREPWVNFEAGAMSRSIDQARVSPFLVGLQRSDIEGPLSQFQSTILEKEDVRKLVHSMNRASDRPLAADRVDRTFELCWPGLAREIEPLARSGASPPEGGPGVEQRGELHEKQVEILVLLARQPDSYPAAQEIAPRVGLNVTRTEYHLDRLRDHGLIAHVLTIGEPAGHYLTQKGRAYVVERDLV